MKKNITIIIILQILLSLLSCSEGLLNFTEETCTLILRLDPTSETTSNINNIVLNFKNNDTGDSLKKELTCSETGDVVLDTIYRMDTGSWDYTIEARNGSNAILTTSSGEVSFEPRSFNTFKININSEDELIVEVKKNSNSKIEIKKFNVIQTATHFHTAEVDQTSYSLNLYVDGYGFENHLQSGRIIFPDSTEWEGYLIDDFSTLNLHINYNPFRMKFLTNGYLMNGTFTLYLTDYKNVEQSTSDECIYEYINNNSYGGFAYLNDSSVNGTTLSFDNNNSTPNGCFIVYFYKEVYSLDIIFEDDLGGVFTVNESTGTSIQMPTLQSGEWVIVLATIDTPISDDVLEKAFYDNPSQNIAPEGFIDWIANEIDDINFIGVSSMKQTF